MLIPDLRAGCSLADSITGGRRAPAARSAIPGVPVVTYVNTSAAVKAESDICCTSANAVKVVESLGVDARDLPARRVSGASTSPRRPRSRSSSGTGTARCTSGSPAEELARLPRRAIDGVLVLAHPECPPEVLAEADFVGLDGGDDPTTCGERRPTRVLMITECSMSDNVAAELPDVEFVRPCNLCPHMKRITLPKIRRSLRDDGATRSRSTRRWPAARAPAVERMLAVRLRRRRCRPRGQADDGSRAWWSAAGSRVSADARSAWRRCRSTAR